MTKLTLRKIGLPYVPLRCPHCQETQAVKVPHSQPFLLRCDYCRRLTVAKLISAKAPNRLNLRLAAEGIFNEAFHE